MTNNEFFRKNAPSGSVAKQTNHKASKSFTQGFYNKNNFANKKGSHATPIAKSSGMPFNTSAYATPFYLEKEHGNKYKINE